MDTLSSQDKPFSGTSSAGGYQVRVGDASLERLPDDLHVPADAMIVLLGSFEGPLDLLLYLIRKHDLNILDFSLADITVQYMQYIELMSTLRLQLAGEYLVIAATLMMIKSRALLPTVETESEEEEDASADLRRRLLAYERLKTTAQNLDALPRVDRDVFIAQIPLANVDIVVAPPVIELKELTLVLADVLQRAKLFQQLRVTRTPISVRERMTDIIAQLNIATEFVRFDDLFNVHEGKVSLIASLLAILELVRSSMVQVNQQQPFAPIFVRLRESAEIA